MESLLAAILIGSFCLVVVTWAWWFARSRALLRRWAEEHGLVLLHAERRWLRRGPPWWRASRNQCVFHVRVRDHAGVEHAGYVRLGGWFLGLLTDEISVVWEEPRH